MKRRYAPIPAAPAWLLEVDAQERARQRQRYPRVDPGPQDLADLVRLHWERIEDEIRAVRVAEESAEAADAAAEALAEKLEERLQRRRERVLGVRAIYEFASHD